MRPLDSFDDVVASYDLTVGLEVHAQLATKTKMWCGCAVKDRALENSLVCPVCSAQPGSLPRLNEKAVQLAIRAALALECSIAETSYFDRKSYFYPDLPKGYQISQYGIPLGSDGKLKVVLEHGEHQVVGIERVQLEEDTGKSTHEETGSLINLNRAGTPLIEIVGRPDLHHPKEASAYLKELHAILVYLGVCKGNMQEGNFRCDANISLAPKGDTRLGVRTEVKNLNSFKNVEKAIEYEARRQAARLQSGESILQQTMLFDAQKLQTRPMRTKTDADDYRYFPEPDLTPLIVTPREINEIEQEIPELPSAKKNRFQKQYQLSSYDADVLVSSKELAEYFEQSCQSFSGRPKTVANFILTNLLKLWNEASIGAEKSPVSPKQLRELLEEVEKKTISNNAAKELIVEMVDLGKNAKELIKEKGLEQISDESYIRGLAQQVISDHPEQVSQYKGGKDRLFGFFVGKVMQETKGKANPELTASIFKEMLS